MFDHLLESSHRDDSNKWSNIGFGEEINILEIKIRFLSSALLDLRKTHKNMIQTNQEKDWNIALERSVANATWGSHALLD